MATGKLTTRNGLMFTNELTRLSQSQYLANLVKARQSLIERSELVEILLIYVRIKLMFYV